ncbi:hypothetical protein [Maribacter sp. 2210JD10-5]|uniref:hypothetical protein n=1 Tax=Maribacter sp. 2210JD10-5 TaxID=3386272 RepID=UPI0039BD1080
MIIKTHIKNHRINYQINSCEDNYTLTWHFILAIDYNGVVYDFVRAEMQRISAVAQGNTLFSFLIFTKNTNKKYCRRKKSTPHIGHAQTPHKLYTLLPTVFFLN